MFFFFGCNVAFILQIKKRKMQKSQVKQNAFEELQQEAARDLAVIELSSQPLAFF